MVEHDSQARFERDAHAVGDEAPRRVVIFINFVTRGGAEVQMLRLAEGLRAAGEDVLLLTIEPPRALADRVQATGVPSLMLTRGRGRIFRALPALVEAIVVLRRLRPDVLICAVYQATVLGRVAGRLAGVPVVVSSLRNERQTSAARDLALRVTAPLDHWTTTNSAAVADRLAHSRAVRRKRLEVIPNALELPPAGSEGSVHQASDTSSERARVRRDLDVDDRTFLWLAVGRLEPQKDHVTLLDAFARLRSGDPGEQMQHRLAIVGAGRLHDDLSRWVVARGLEADVLLLGPRDDVPRLLSAADGLVLSSRWEGLPNVVMEAMAASLPVVATHVGGTPELVDDGCTGVLVPPGEPEVLAQGMRRIGRMTSQERAEWGARGRARVLERYDPEAVTRRWLDLLDRLAPQRATRNAGGD